MKFSELQPFVARSQTIPDALELNFNCPGCGTRLVIPVWPHAPRESHPTIWRGRNMADMNFITIEPSLKDTAHPRQSTCTLRHFSVINGEIKPE